jgi:ubiquinone/menaquinone biosynthesis C-methylase UbiE
MLTRQATQAFYDRFGARQDAQSFYEDRALDALIAHSAFESAQHVFELGVGTGRFAERLLRERLSEQARYTGTDLSATMIALARERLATYRNRVEITATDGAPTCPLAAGAVDRVVSTYVLDLLPEDEIAAFLADAHRVLAAGGQLCLVGLTDSHTFPSNVVSTGWTLLFRTAPGLVGGCRPIHLEPVVATRGFTVIHTEVVVAYGIASEVLVAEKSPGATGAEG